MANPKSEEARQAYIDKNPFDGLKIADTSVLNMLEGRHPCPHCGKSRKYFCYTCYVPIAELEGKLPRIKLPIKIDIIKHKHEIDGKSTAGHAAILAPNDTKIYTYPNIPDYGEGRTVLIFPSIHAVSIQQLFTENYSDLMSSRQTDVAEELPKGVHQSTLLKKRVSNKATSDESFKRNRHFPITKAVFIDSTWNQSKGIYKDERLRKLPCVFLQNRVSQFWRHQKGSPRWYLATIEAIHQFLVEIHLMARGLHAQYEGLKNCFTEKCLSDIEKLKSFDNIDAYNGQYDDLLFFFKHMYDLIHAYYDHDNLYAYKRRLL